MDGIIKLGATCIGGLAFVGLIKLIISSGGI